MPRLLLGAIHEREGADEMLGEAAEPRAVCLPRWRLELPGDSLAGTFPPAVRRVRGVRASFGDFFVGPSEKGMGSASSTQTVLMAPPGRSLPPPAAPSREGSLFGGPLLEIEPLQPEGPPDSELSASPAGELFTGPPEMGGDDMDAMGPAQMGMPDLQLESASEPKDIDGPKDEVIEYWAVAEPGENGQTIVHQGHAVHHIRHGKDFVEHHQALRHHNHRHYVRHVGHGSGHRRHHHEHREAKPATAHEKPDRSQSEPLLVAPPQPLPQHQQLQQQPELQAASVLVPALHPESLPRAAPPAAVAVPEAATEPTIEPPVSPAPVLSRMDLVRAVFNACDANGDGRLSAEEMRAFAGHIGFEGGDNDWSSEFQMLCEEHGRTAQDGVDREMFSQLVNDQTDAGCYCSDDELRIMVRDFFPEVRARTAAPPAAAAPPVPAPPPAPTQDPAEVPARTKLIRSVFEALDRDGDQRLSSQEMYRLASMVGFQGNDGEWQAEFASLFEGKQDTPEAGMRVEHFEELVNDCSDNGCYCTDDELDKLSAGLAAEARMALVDGIFCLLDADNVGRLDSDCLWRFTHLANFPVSHEQLALIVCPNAMTAREAVVWKDGFGRLVNGATVPECYCSTEQLRQILEDLQQGPIARPSDGAFSGGPPGLPPPPGLSALSD
mmetsp:Transcript_78046/g.246529  ORF Transcript_78046/g.246529 Transcript_78046/m.246529 type:complete len:665 (+) Transcript_78046:60-2054(+)